MTFGRASSRHFETNFCRKIWPSKELSLHAKLAAFYGKLTTLFLPSPLQSFCSETPSRLRFRDNIVTPGRTGDGLVWRHDNDAQKQKQSQEQEHTPAGGDRPRIRPLSRHAPDRGRNLRRRAGLVRPRREHRRAR